MTDTYFTTQEAFTYLKISRAMLFKLRTRGVIKSKKYGKLLRWPKSSLDRFLTQRMKTV